jgi:hypothetical protein
LVLLCSTIAGFPHLNPEKNLTRLFKSSKDNAASTQLLKFIAHSGTIFSGTHQASTMRVYWVPAVMLE